MKAIETGKSLVVVTSLTVRTRDDKHQQLDVEMSVSTYEHEQRSRPGVEEGQGQDMNPRVRSARRSAAQHRADAAAAAAADVGRLSAVRAVRGAAGVLLVGAARARQGSAGDGAVGGRDERAAAGDRHGRQHRRADAEAVHRARLQGERHRLAHAADQRRREAGALHHRRRARAARAVLDAVRAAELLVRRRTRCRATVEGQRLGQPRRVEDRRSRSTSWCSTACPGSSSRPAGCRSTAPSAASWTSSVPKNLHRQRQRHHRRRHRRPGASATARPS